MTYEVICKHCGKSFTTHTRKSVFCSKECRVEYFVHKKMVDASDNLKKNGIEGKDYVIDKWNGMAVRRLYGAYFKKAHPGRTIEEYKTEFPDAPIYSEIDNLNVGKSRGLHMKEDKYKKLFSERIRGDKNPMSKTRTTEEQRKSNSPFSIKFYETRGMGKTELHEFVNNINQNRKPSSYNTKLEYYTSKGYTVDEAKRKLSIRQSTRSLESCIKKYGEYGYELYRIRNKAWSEKMEEMYKKGLYSKAPKFSSIGYSEEEHEFIETILQSELIDESKCLYYKNSISEQLRLKGKGTIYYYDFVYGNKIVEFNGTYWHCDPRVYDKSHIIKGGKTAIEIWERDLQKTKIAIDNGYKVFHMWEIDYIENKESIIKECIRFLTT